MSVDHLPPATTQRVDHLMRDLYRRSQGRLHQTLLADYSIADAYRNHLAPSYPVSNRPIVRVARTSWRILKGLVGVRYAAQLGGALWMITGIPALAARGLKLHPGAYTRQGDPGSKLVLLRTGVANEPLIARWIERREHEPVVMLQYNDKAGTRLSSLRYLPRLLQVHITLCLQTIREISRITKETHLNTQELDALVPSWFVLLARQAMSISWNHVWAETNLKQQPPQRLYFTMNYANENAFRLALPQVPAAYVEHGFPRRDLPPLPCAQYVYSHGYANYLQSFDNSLNVEVIGLDYFDKGEVDPTKTIVVASLQDWPQYKIERDKDKFNAALDEARRTGWKLVFRTRRYDTDAFADALKGPWDEISKAADETFHECLTRTRPAMVWTTWSTAVLDARAQNVTPVAFTSPDLDDYFISDLNTFAFVVRTDEAQQKLFHSLQQDDIHIAKELSEPAIGAAHSIPLIQACN
jgi:hypothetical protein